MSKTGNQHLKSLRDGREVYLNGKKVDDVTKHPAFKNAVAATANLYDFQSDPKNIEYMTFESPTSKKRVNRCWQLTKSYDELVIRRKSISSWAKLSAGWLGRSPDHIASSMVGQVMGLNVFENHSPDRAKALLDYFNWARDQDHYMTYVIINPQANRNKNISEQKDEFLATAVVDEDSEGITVRGGKMLGTGSIMANEILFANIQPLMPGEEKYAISFAIPMNTKGLKIMSRKSYEETATSTYDYPLSSRFDENEIINNYDIVFKLTSNDPCLDHRNIISILHLQGKQQNCKSVRILSLTPYISGNNIFYTFPVFSPVVNDSSNNMITMIGFYDEEKFDQDTIQFIHTNQNYTFNFIIRRYNNRYEQIKKIQNVKLYVGISTSEMINIIQSSKYILSKKIFEIIICKISFSWLKDLIICLLSLIR